ncbi:hypothetical protein [Pseudomonas fluorescens]
MLAGLMSQWLTVNANNLTDKRFRDKIDVTAPYVQDSLRPDQVQ